MDLAEGGDLLEVINKNKYMYKNNYKGVCQKKKFGELLII